ncbi:MAG: DUF2279 domain-containing protein [Bacteroidota bacterium]
MLLILPLSWSCANKLIRTFSAVILVLCLPFGAKTQSFFENDSVFNKKRCIGVTALNSAVGAGSIIALQSVWYSDYEKTPMHSFNDSRNWLQMDKAGHVYASYHFNELVAKTYRWSGMNRKKSALLGAAYGWGYQFGIELLDGRSSGWGFSWSDVTANTLGTVLYTAQEFAFEKQIFKVKFSYWPSDVAQYRPKVLGSNFQERLLKDYNAQTYWLTFSPFAFRKNSSFPKWIGLALGYSVHDKLVGDQEVYTAEGGQTFYSKREFILSLDLDVKELPIRKKWLKAVLSPFNSIKIPFPALVWRGGLCYGKMM